MDGPWIDMNWPSFNAAPLIRPRVETSRLIFASLINTLPLLFPPVDRRMDSDAAPHESDAASAVGTVSVRFVHCCRGSAYSHSGRGGRGGKQVPWTHARSLASCRWIGC